MEIRLLGVRGAAEMAAVEETVNRAAAVITAMEAAAVTVEGIPLADLRQPAQPQARIFSAIRVLRVSSSPLGR